MVHAIGFVHGSIIQQNNFLMVFLGSYLHNNTCTSTLYNERSLVGQAMQTDVSLYVHVEKQV